MLLTSCESSHNNEFFSYFNEMSYSKLQEKIKEDKLLLKDILTPPSNDNMPQKEIIDGYMVEIIKHFKKNLNIKNGESTISKFKIKIIHQKNEIAFYELYKIKSVKKNDKWINKDCLISMKVNKKSYNELLKKYRNSYDIELNIDRLFNNSFIYGESCGIVGKDPIYRLEMNQIIETNDKEKLLDWLKSPVTELQLYAMEAVYKMEKKGMIFTSKVYSMIQLIEKKKGRIKVCSGCHYGYEDISKKVATIKKSA